MTGRPLVEMRGVVKDHGGGAPLRIQALEVHRGDRVALLGLDAAAAETLVHLVTGAALPDQGEILIDGMSTRDIATDTAWLASLDRFGIVTARAVLIDKLTAADNLALPLTVSIDPIPDEFRQQVDRLAAEVDLPPERLAGSAESLSPGDRIRLHLARAIALNPELLIVDYPTRALDADTISTIGQTLKRVANARELGWLLLSDDERLVRAAGGTRLQLRPDTGAFGRAGLLGKLLG